MFFPLRTDSPLHRTPWTNYLIIFVNFAIFLLQWGNPQWTGTGSRYDLNPDHPLLRDYVTYAFLHQSLLHIASNMLFLYIFGNNVNDKMGHVGYAAFYLASCVAARLSANQ